MSRSLLSTGLTAVTLSALALGALAQANSSGTPAPSTSASAPGTAVGVSTDTARSANQKAVPSSDTGTVVRTGPSAMSQVGQQAHATGSDQQPMGENATMPAKQDRN